MIHAPSGRKNNTNDGHIFLGMRLIFLTFKYMYGHATPADDYTTLDKTPANLKLKKLRSYFNRRLPGFDICVVLPLSASFRVFVSSRTFCKQSKQNRDYGQRPCKKY